MQIFKFCKKFKYSNFYNFQNPYMPVNTVVVLHDDQISTCSTTSFYSAKSHSSQSDKLSLHSEVSINLLDFCRICQSTGDKMLKPCKCKGSVS